MSRAAWAVAAVALLSSAAALAQRFEVKRPETLVIGRPTGDSPADRVDGRRSGFSRSALPTTSLRAGWRRAVGLDVDAAPLVGQDGEIEIITARGDIVSFSPDGQERRRLSVGVGVPGPGALLSDGTLVLVNGAGEAVGIRGGAIRFRTRIGERNASQKAAPLALDDGGVVVAVGPELATLDAQGNVRARASLPEPAVWPLVAAMSKVVAITADGAVYLWAPGRREAALAGTFGGQVTGGAVAESDRSLLAVVESSHLAALDLERGATLTRSLAQGGLYLGPPSMRGATAYLLSLTLGSVLATSIDPSGQDVVRHSVETTTLALMQDGGVAPLVAPSRTPTLVDEAGTLAFGTPEGHVGVVTASGDVHMLGETICTPPRNQRWPAPGIAPGRAGTGFAGFAPAGPGGFVVACESGQLTRVSGAD